MEKTSKIKPIKIKINKKRKHCSDCIIMHLSDVVGSDQLAAPIQSLLKNICSQPDNIKTQIMPTERIIHISYKWEHLEIQYTITATKRMKVGSILSVKIAGKTTQMRFKILQRKQTKEKMRKMFELLKTDPFFYVKNHAHEDNDGAHYAECVKFETSEICAICLESFDWLIVSPCCKSVGSAICGKCYEKTAEIYARCWICRKETDMLNSEQLKQLSSAVIACQ